MEISVTLGSAELHEAIEKWISEKLGYPVSAVTNENSVGDIPEKITFDIERKEDIVCPKKTFPSTGFAREHEFVPGATYPPTQ